MLILQQYRTNLILYNLRKKGLCYRSRKKDLNGTKKF